MQIPIGSKSAQFVFFPSLKATPDLVFFQDIQADPELWTLL